MAKTEKDKDSGLSVHDLGLDSLMHRITEADDDVDVDVSGIESSSPDEINRTFKVNELLTETATGVLASSVYSASITLTFRKPYRKPPVCLGFIETASGNRYSLPALITVESKANLIGGFLDGVIVKHWANLKIYRDKVTIDDYSTTSFTNNYAIYVLQHDKDV